MHTAILTFHHDPATWAEQQPELHNRIIPFVKQSPGFVAGYWTYDAKESRTVSFIVFENATQAEALRRAVREQTQGKKGPVTLESIRIAEILAEEARDG